MGGFETYRRNLMQRRLSASVFMMAIPLYLGFSLLDWYCTPDLWVRFLWIRVFSCFVMGILALLFKLAPDFAAKNIVYISHLSTLIVGLGIGYMAHLTGGLSSPYYAGLNWIAIGSLAFWPGRMKDRLVTIIAIYGGLIAMEVTTGRFQIDQTSILTLTFMVGTCLLSVLNNILILRSLEQEFDLRGELQELIKNKDQIIEVKSNESANLKRLAKQFSPDVIRAIESQTISLNERTRRKVAIMFIDVVGSTNRSNNLDHGDYQRALDLFFDFTIKRLLARNITVANFMGDGLLAIANAPYKMADFEVEAFETALQILDEVRAKRVILNDLWRGEFLIRIGISSGFANVGFFPNSDFGVYTAIGESVNLASRLCSAAEASSIATTKAVISAWNGPSDRFQIKRGGSIGELKGFSGFDLEYYLATPIEAKVDSKESSCCPLCNSQLGPPTDLGDCFIVKCDKCKFSDILDKSDITKAAA